MSKKKKDNLSEIKPRTRLEKEKQKQRDIQAEVERVKHMSPEERAKYYKKPPLARFWDKFFPGDYTMSQDKKHALAVFSVIAVILLLAVAALWVTLDRAEYDRSETLIIPKSSYARGSEQNVVDLLEGYGYSDISVNMDSITAKGSPEKVKAYQDSFYDKSVKEAVEDLTTTDFAYLGVDRLVLSDDFKTLTIYTPLYLNRDADAMSDVVVGTTIDDIISALHAWCAMKNNNEPLTVRFSTMADPDNDIEEEVYFTTTSTSNGSQIVADVEREIAKVTEEKSANTASNDATSNGNDDAASSEE